MKGIEKEWSGDDVFLKDTRKSILLEQNIKHGRRVSLRSVLIKNELPLYVVGTVIENDNRERYPVIFHNNKIVDYIVQSLRSATRR